MVGLRAKVLGRLGRRPHPRASALSCPSLDIYGPGSLPCDSPGPRLAAKASGGPIGTAPKRSPGRLPPPALRVPRRRAERACTHLSRLLSGTRRSLPTVGALVTTL